jgi:hypothetical protein
MFHHGDKKINNPEKTYWLEYDKKVGIWQNGCLGNLRNGIELSDDTVYRWTNDYTILFRWLEGKLKVTVKTVRQSDRVWEEYKNTYHILAYPIFSNFHQSKSETTLHNDIFLLFEKHLLLLSHI